MLVEKLVPELPQHVFAITTQHTAHMSSRFAENSFVAVTSLSIMVEIVMREPDVGLILERGCLIATNYYRRHHHHYY